MFTRLKEFLIGSLIPTQRMFEEKLNKVRALAAFHLMPYLPLHTQIRKFTLGS